MNEGFLCEATPFFVRARLTRELTEWVLEECQYCVLQALRRTSGLSGKDWGIRVVEEKRLRDRRMAHRDPGGRRRHGHVAP